MHFAKKLADGRKRGGGNFSSLEDRALLKGNAIIVPRGQQYLFDVRLSAG